MKRAGRIVVTLNQLGSRLLKANSSSRCVWMTGLFYDPSSDSYEIVLRGDSLPECAELEMIPIVDADDYLR